MQDSTTALKAEAKFDMVSFEYAVTIAEFLVTVGEYVWNDQPLLVLSDGSMLLSSHYGTVSDIFVCLNKPLLAGEHILKIDIIKR